MRPSTKSIRMVAADVRKKNKIARGARHKLLSSKTLSERLASSKQSRAATLTEILHRALAESRASGKLVRFSVTVSPEGKAKVTRINIAGEVPGTVETEKVELDRAIAAARERGRVRVAEILEGPEMLSADAFAAALGTTRVTVNTWRQKHRVLGLDGARRGFRFPEWQIGEDGKPFAVLPELFERLGGTPWAVYRFLVQHHAELGGLTGREALRRGHDAVVLEAAESVDRAFG